MASLHTLERRIAALEARLADVEGGYGETLYSLRRSAVRNELRMGRVLKQMGIDDVSDEDIDHILDDEDNG
ncbi:MAG: hypothetical protein ACRDUV_15615 [Pseudonocardiaceae bacterium]